MTPTQPQTELRPWISKETLIPWSSAFAFAGLAWWGASRFGDLNMAIQKSAADVAEKVAEQRTVTSLELQELKLTSDHVNQRLDRLEKSVDALTRASEK